MADLTAIENALAAQVTAHTGLRAMAQVRDQVNPPVAVIIPGQPLITYGTTMDGTLTLNLVVVVLVSDAPPPEKAQRALNTYLGVGSGQAASIAHAVELDPTLGGTVHFCVPVSASPPGRIEWAGETYFGARVTLQAGAI